MTYTLRFPRGRVFAEEVNTEETMRAIVYYGGKRLCEELYLYSTNGADEDTIKPICGILTKIAGITVYCPHFPILDRCPSRTTNQS